MGAEMVIGQVGGGVNKNLVNGVGVDIVRGDELQIGLVDPGGDLQIPGHAGRCSNEFDLQTGVFFQSLGICRSPGKVESSVLAPQCLLLPDRSLQPLGVGRARPGILYPLREGETARQMVFSVREVSATTRWVVSGSSPRSMHSTEA